MKIPTLVDHYSLKNRSSDRHTQQRRHFPFAQRLVICAIQSALAFPMLSAPAVTFAQSCPSNDNPPDPQDANEGSSPVDPQASAPTPDDDVSPTGNGAAPAPSSSGGGAVTSDDGDSGGAVGSPSGTDGDGSDGGGGSFDWGGADLGDVGGGFGGGGGGGGSFEHMLDPIDLSHADKKHVQVDYVSRGAAPLRVGRVYHSSSVVNIAKVTIPMGAGWRSFYDRSIEAISGTHVRLHRANGNILDFTTGSSGVWTSSTPGGVLSGGSSSWTYVNDRNIAEIYSTSGRLTGLSDGQLVTSLKYDGSGRLATVTNPFGRSLGFSYDGSGRVSTVALPDNSTLGYSYDGHNNLTGVRFADNSVRQYVYENGSFANALTGVVDESGRRRLTWGYDAAGRASSGYYGGGTNAVSAAYSGNQVTTTDARNTTRTRTFATVNGLQVLTALQTSATADSAATGWSFAYDAYGNRQAINTRVGEVQQLTSDSRGRSTSATRAAGTSLALQHQMTWHPTFRLPIQSIRYGVTHNFSIDAAGHVTQVTRVSGSSSATVLTRSYNAQNLVQSVTNARGGTTSYTYDSAGNVSTVTDPLGKVTTYSNYTAHGQAGKIQRADGTVITRTFDARFRLTSRVVAGATTQYGYDAAGRIAKITAPDGSWRSYAYDSGGFLTSVASDRSDTTTIARDVTGSATKRSTYTSSGTLTKVSSRQFNAVGHVASVTDSRNYATKYLYGSDGRFSGSLDPLSLQRTRQLDVLSRPTSLTLPNTTAMRNAGGAATATATFGYDGSNNATSVVDTNTVATGYAYDTFNRRIGESGNDAGGTGMVRNAAGDVTSITDPRGITLTPSYDALGRVTSIANGSTTDRNYTYVSGRTDSLLSNMSDASGSSAWTYDSAGRMLTQQQVISGVKRSVTIARDAVGRPTSITYPSGMVVGISYSADVISAMTINGTSLLSNVSYLPQSSTATGWRWGNGTSYGRSFDADGRVTSVSLGTLQRSYSYNAGGYLTTQTDTTSTGAKSSSTYAYDEAGQLISYTPPSGSTWAFTYDTNGNRRSGTGSNGPSTYTYAANSNRLTSANGATYSYNADGTVKTTGQASLTYDIYGRLATLYVPNLLSNSYAYNGLGQRALRTSSVYGACSSATQSPYAPSTAAPQVPCSPHWSTPGTMSFVYDTQGHLLGEYASGYSQETIWFNGQPVATVQGSTIYYVNDDNLGTPRSIVRASDNAEVWHWDGEPFGGAYPTGSITYDLRFPGQVYDTSGIYYNGMRDYDSTTGRYIEPDPLRLGGGLARYTYVGANPLTNTDPQGLVGADTIAAALAGAVGGGIVNGFNFYSLGCSFSTGFINGAIGGAIGGAAFSLNPTAGGALGGAVTQLLNQSDGVSSLSNPVLDVGFAAMVGGLTGWTGSVAGVAAASDGPEWLQAALGVLGSSTDANTANIWANLGGTIKGDNPPAQCHR